MVHNAGNPFNCHPESHLHGSVCGRGGRGGWRGHNQDMRSSKGIPNSFSSNSKGLELALSSLFIITTYEVLS